MTRFLRPVGLAAIAALTAGTVACGDNPPAAPRPGQLEITLETPNVGDGALLFFIQGAELDSVESLGLDLRSSPLSATARRVVVAGALVSGPVARVWVPDVGQAGRYRATVEQVADAATYALRDTTGYRLIIGVVPAP
jgi:hypothetical protein